MTSTDTTHDPAHVASPTVEVSGVSKWFGQKVAVSDLSCSFGPGVAGLLGPNGAGKTTLLRMLTGLALPSEGTVRVLGRTPRTDHELYRQMALVPEESAVYASLTARQLIRTAAVLSGVDGADTATSKALSLVELGDAADRAVGGFSKGMRQRRRWRQRW